jgi:PAS domain S-box-containing protein
MMERSEIHLMIVEDNPGDFRIVSAILEECPNPFFNIRHAESLGECMKVLDIEKIDVVLLDLGLPDSSGFSGLEKIISKYKLLPIVILTGQDDERIGIEALQKNAADYLVKGQINENLLVRTLRYAIERKRVEEELVKARDELEERVKFRTKELNELNRELQEEIVTRGIAEEKLRETGEILEKIFSTTHISIAYLDREFTYMRVNRAYAEEFGLEENFFVGKNHFSLFPDTKNEEIFRTTVDTGNPYSAIAQPFKNPNIPVQGIIYLDWSLSPVKDHDGSVEGLIHIFINVTERVLSHQRILESEKKFRDLAESLPQTIIETDSQGNITFVNQNGLLTFGFDDTDFQKGLNIFNTVVPDEIEKAKKDFAEILMKRRPTSNEYVAKRKDDTPFPIDIYANPILHNGMVTGVRAVVIDITER